MSVVIEKLKELLLCGYCPPALVQMEGEIISAVDHSIELTHAEIFAE